MKRDAKKKAEKLFFSGKEIEVLFLEEEREKESEVGKGKRK